MKCLYKLKWAEGDDKWHLICPLNNAFIMHLPDCDNFRTQFENPDKSVERLYVVSVKKASKES